MVGADVTMLCSTILRHGAPQIALIERDLVEWLQEHDYESVSQLKGSLSQKSCAEPAAYERAQYMKALTGFALSRT
jgi:dihydroorotate dehydrogenase (fumarate)